VPKSSAVPPYSSPSKESTRGGRNRHRPSPLPCRFRARRRRNTPPPALLWPLRPPQPPQGEHPVRKDSSPSPIPRPSAALSWSPAATSARDGRAGSLTQSDRPARPADMALGPHRSVAVGQMTPVTKVLRIVFFNSREFQKIVQSCKMHIF
jgi:hypothetical protein